MVRLNAFVGKLAVVLIALFTVTAQAEKVLYVRGETKVYPLLPPMKIHKTNQEMQLEASQGKRLLRASLDEKKAPRRGDLINYTTPVRNQGKRGTCVAFASIALVETELNANGKGSVDLSEQYAYWAAKAVLGINANGDGALPLDVLTAVEQQGVPMEQEWPYEPTGWFDDAINHPSCVLSFFISPDSVPTKCVTNGDAPTEARMAKKVKVTNVTLGPTSPEFIAAAIKNKIPVELGFSVYKKAWGFDDVKADKFKEGKVSVPDATDEEIGGHAVLIVGYDLDRQEYIFKNSWGVDEWGSKEVVVGAVTKPKGFGTIPMDYVRKFGIAAIALPN